MRLMQRRMSYSASATRSSFKLPAKQIARLQSQPASVAHPSYSCRVLFTRCRCPHSHVRRHASSGDSSISVKVQQHNEPEQNSGNGHVSNSNTNGASSSANGSSHAVPAEIEAAAPANTEPLPQRWSIVAMMALAFVVCNMDKVNMSVAVIPMAQELGWTATERGLVSSSFFWGYCLTQIPAGWISTKIGGAKVLLGGVALWSIATALAPPAAHISLALLCFSRMLVGLGEGFAPSAVTNVMATVVPQSERSRAVTTVFGGLDVGSAVGLVLCGPLIQHFGWPSVFYLFAVLGFVWCAFWPSVHHDLKDLWFGKKSDAVTSAAAAAPAAAEKPKEEDKTPVPWKAFMTSAPVWAVITAHFCFNWGYYTLLAWLPSYFEMALGLSVEKSSFLTLIPYIAMIAMTPLIGPVADGLVNKGMNLTRVRKLCQNIAFLVPAACMLALAVLTPSGAAAAGVSVSGAPIPVLVAVMSMAFGFSAWARAGLYCNHQDLSPKYASALLGISNTFGAFPGILGVMSAGWLFDQTSSWALALFLPTAACQIFGSIIYTIFASSERQSWS